MISAFLFPLHNHKPMQVHYLEIVAANDVDVDVMCDAYSKIHGVSFGERDQYLGNARTAPLGMGSTGIARVGIRAPMHDQERPVVRPYSLTSDLVAAVNAAVHAGGTVAVPPMQLGGRLGSCAIVMFGQIESGFWQLE